MSALMALSAAVAPAGAAPAARNAKPKVISATADAARAAEREVSVTITGRDADDVVRGAEITWGDGQPA